MQNLRLWLLTACMLLSSTLYAQWESLGTGLDGGQLRIYSFSVIDANTIWGVAAGTAANGSRQFTRTIDGGDNFTTGAINDGASDYTNVHLFALSADLAWVAQNKTSEGDEARIFTTVDGGQNWTEQAGPFNADGRNVKVVHFFDSNAGLAFGSAGTNENAVSDLHIYTTDDGGDTWTEVDAGSLPTPLPNEGTWTSAGNNGYDVVGNTVWFGTTGKRVWKSVDQGRTWAASPVQFSNLNGGVNSVAFQDANNGVAVSEFGEAATTSDGGVSWGNYTTFAGNPAPAVVEYIPGTAGTYLIADGIYGLPDLRISNDGGQTWTSFIPTGENGMNTTISTVGLTFLSANQGFASTSITNGDQGGLLSWDESLPGVSSIAGPEAIAGLRAFPNPTQDHLTVQWTAAQVDRIELLDAQGRRLHQQAPGLAQAVDLSLADQPAGIYLLRIRAGEQISTLRVIRQ